MCGIAGMLSFGRVDAAFVARMTGALRHRGPDDEGLWTDADAGISLGHRRLAIVDLSANGHQPMLSRNGRYVLTFNGEIYNHRALRMTLEAQNVCEWRGHSDTETLIEAIAAWGLKRTLRLCVGMFALALWDRDERTLFLARDRFGEKPLYHGRVGADFLFASELKAIRAHRDFAAEIDRGALSLFAARGYVPAPLSIFQGISKLMPGTILAVNRAGESAEPYWSYREIVEGGLADPLPDTGSAMRALESALATSIRDQSVADVPVGAFLSGGVDSSTIVALWRKHSSRDLKTYSIGFEEAGLDEAPYARAVARQDKRIATEVGKAKAQVRAAREQTRQVRGHVADETQVIQVRTDQVADVRDRLLASENSLAGARSSKRSALADTRESRRDYINEVEALAAVSARLTARSPPW